MPSARGTRHLAAGPCRRAQRIGVPEGQPCLSSFRAGSRPRRPNSSELVPQERAIRRCPPRGWPRQVLDVLADRDLSYGWIWPPSEMSRRRNCALSLKPRRRPCRVMGDPKRCGSIVRSFALPGSNSNCLYFAPPACRPPVAYRASRPWMAARRGAAGGHVEMRTPRAPARHDRVDARAARRR